MSFQEFDTMIDRMQLAYDYAENLGQYVDAAKILFQMNECLPDNLQLFFEDLTDRESAKLFTTKYSSELKSVIVDYRQKLMNI